MESRSPTFGPASGEERYVLIDALRGFALLGVLIANFDEAVLYLLKPEVAASLPTAAWDGYCRMAESFLVKGKALFVFSLLFGLGLSVQMARADARGRDIRPVYLRRLLVLFVIGILHLRLLWYVDILHIYALAGLVLFLLRHRGDRFLLIAGTLGAYLSFTSLMVSWGLYSLAGEGFDLDAYNAQVESGVAQITSGYAGALRTIWDLYARNITPPVFVAIAVYALGVFLLGYLVGRRRYLQDAPRHLGTFRRVLVWGLAIGLTGNAWHLYAEATIPGSSPWFIPAHLPDMVSTIALSLAYVAAVVLLWQRPWARRLIALMAPAGRMALTNYLLHSVLYLVVLSGVGFALAGKIGSAWALAVSVGYTVSQVAVSHLWLRFFRFGPAEWLWRSLTYLKPQPWRV